MVDIETGTPLETNPDGAARGRRGEEIPLFGRIVAIADVFDALCSARAYKEAWSEKDVLAEIRGLVGTKFDPELVDVFFEVLPNIQVIAGKYPDNDESCVPGSVS